jgi:hypothetical protein
MARLTCPLFLLLFLTNTQVTKHSFLFCKSIDFIVGPLCSLFSEVPKAPNKANIYNPRMFKGVIPIAVGSATHDHGECSSMAPQGRYKPHPTASRKLSSKKVFQAHHRHFQGGQRQMVTWLPSGSNFMCSLNLHFLLNYHWEAVGWPKRSIATLGSCDCC